MDGVLASRGVTKMAGVDLVVCGVEILSETEFYLFFSGFFFCIMKR